MGGGGGMVPWPRKMVRSFECFEKLCISNANAMNIINALKMKLQCNACYANCISTVKNPLSMFYFATYSQSTKVNQSTESTDGNDVL